MKVVINRCFGGFGLSPEALLWLYKKSFDFEGFKYKVEEYFGDLESDKPLSFKESLKKWKEYKSSKKKDKDSLFVTVFTPDEKHVLSYERSEKFRTHPLVIECVEKLKGKADGACADLKIVEIPDGVDWYINEYDGLESINESHRSWS
jgi:hypothetical protein